ncbi:hypothetical protein [Asticcacaulis sp.]|uniref:hypothetical protein n=1 Tax=Asticcacaulis sp. TaxID=1872648 RepID=UPI00391B21EA
MTRDPSPPLPDLVAVDADSDPNAARRLDPDGRSPEHWFPLFQAREAGMDASPLAMSADTLCALKTLDAEAEAIARKRNWAYLDTHLSAIGLFPEREIDFVPLAYPIIVPDAGALSSHLARSRIWCARHWPNLPSPPSFEPAQTLSRCCLSLPLDGRYDLKDMARIVDAVKLYLP